MPHSTRSLLALALASSLAACSSTAPLPAVYSVDQLNGGSGRVLLDDGVGPSASTVAPAPEPGGEPEPPPPAPAALRVVHASPDRAAASVSVFLDDSQVAAVQGIAYRAIAGAVELGAAEHAVHVRAASAAATAAPLVSLTTPALESGRAYTAIVHGLAGANPRLAIALGADDAAQPDAGKAKVRFFHALAGLGAVDLCLPPTPARPAAGNTPAVAAQPARAVFANVAYGAFGSTDAGAYTEVPSGAAVTLQVRAQNARACTGAVRGTVTVTPADRAVVTAVAVGRVAGAPAAPRQLLVCTDAPLEGPPSCAAVAIR